MPRACKREAARKRMADLGEVTSGPEQIGGSEAGGGLGGGDVLLHRIAEWFSRLDNEENDTQPQMIALVGTVALVALVLVFYSFQVTVAHLERGLIAAEFGATWTHVRDEEETNVSLKQLRLQRREERNREVHESGSVLQRNVCAH